MRVLALAMVAVISGCGGGGGSSSPETVAPVEVVAVAPVEVVAAPVVVTPVVVTPVVVAPVVVAPVEIVVDEPAPVVDQVETFRISPQSRELATAQTGSDHYDALMECLVTSSDSDPCTLSRLPLIGMETQDPTVAKIMSRLVVTHEWQRVRFEEMLGGMPPELILMTRSITSFVIASDLSLSFFSPRTGALYISADLMWLSEAEYDQVERKLDFRARYGDDLNFFFLRRYVDDGVDIKSKSRTLSSITESMAATLYHELSHAADSFPPSIIAGLDQSLPITTAWTERKPSSYIQAAYPLNDLTLTSLASVSFRGSMATVEQTQLEGSELGLLFEADAASDYYGYANKSEDFAMVFEEMMMYHSYGIQKDIAFSNNGSGMCGDYPVAWGQRNRLSNPVLKDKALDVASEVLPEYLDSISSSIETLPTVQTLEVGVDWCETLN